MTEEEEAQPTPTYDIGERVIPKSGSHKGQVGRVVEQAWGNVSREWMYKVRFVRTTHIYYDNELRKGEVA